MQEMCGKPASAGQMQPLYGTVRQSVARKEQREVSYVKPVCVVNLHIIENRGCGVRAAASAADPNIRLLEAGNAEFAERARTRRPCSPRSVEGLRVLVCFSRESQQNDINALSGGSEIFERVPPKSDAKLPIAAAPNCLPADANPRGSGAQPE